MLEKREWTSGIVLNYPEKTLWITGGLTKVNDGTTSLKSTEFVYLNKQSERGPDLPVEIHEHCMIKYNDSAVFILGGKLGADSKHYLTPSSKTWIVDPTSNFQISEGPSLPSAKNVMACGKMIIGGKTWLVVGPQGGTDIDLLDPLNVNQGWLKGIYYF